MEKSYMNSALPPEDRARVLMEDMSIEEKVYQLRGIFPFAVGWDDFDSISQQTKCGIGQVSTLQMRDMHTIEECCAWQRKIQKIVMENSPHHIPAVFHMEGLCGAFIQGAASFPSGIARGAGWDPELEEKIGETVSRQEAACGISQILAPVLDISRDPRMGRQGESYGEDPALAAALGSAFTRGIQKNETAGRKTEAAAKHFLAFHNSQGGIHGTHSDTPERLLQEVYGKPFQAAITEADLRGIMPCYCSINGEPITASKRLLHGLLREDMGFDGVLVSDYGAIGNTHSVQHIGETQEEAGLRCLEAGMDLELPNVAAYNEKMIAMFENGQANTSALDAAVLRVLTAKFRMGIFEHPYALEGEEIGRVFSHPEDRELSLRSAEESLVLLKNDGILPMKKIRKLAVIGPHADHANKFFGGYTHLCMTEATYAVATSIAGVDGREGVPDIPEEYAQNDDPTVQQTIAEYKEKLAGVKFVPGTHVQSDEAEVFAQVLRRQKPGCKSLLATLREKLPDTEILYAYGYPVAGRDNSGYGEALKAIASADLAILTLGGKHGTCSIATMGEGVDASNINLPECQEKFIIEAAKFGKPLVGVHLDGRPISSDAADQNLNAILEAWSPAETGGEAIAGALLGQFSPGGKLPVSVAYHAGQVPVYYNHPYGSAWHQGQSIGFADYVDLPHAPRYCFGHGLSYTTFEYAGLTIDKEQVAAGDTVKISFTLTNSGTAAADEVVQLYLQDVYASMTRPVKELAGFRRVHLKPGESRNMEFTVDTSQLAFLDEDMKWKIEHGQINVEVGASSEDIRLTGSFGIAGDKWINGRERRFYCPHLCCAGG